MSLNAASNRNSRSTNAGAAGVPRVPLSTSNLPLAGNAPTLTGTDPDEVSLFAQAHPGLTRAQCTLLNTLRDGARALRWPEKNPDAAANVDVAAYFRSLKANAAQLHEVGQKHPSSSELASWIKAFEIALGRINAALRRGSAKGGLDAGAFSTEELRNIFGALSAFADPAKASLFHGGQRRALQPLLQGLTTTLLKASAKGFASPAAVAQHLPLLNWLCRGVKKDLLKADDDIAELFAQALHGLIGWIGAEDQDATAYQIGECAAILKDVIEHDLLALKARREGAEETSGRLRQCVEGLCGEEIYAVLEKPPINGVAVLNVCNLVKELVETHALSIEYLQSSGQLQRLLTLIVKIPNEQMSGGDGRVLSNAGNFVRLLLRRQPERIPDGKGPSEMVVMAAKRVLAALNAEGFGKGGRNAQSLANLVSFMQDCHEHLLPVCGDEVVRKSFATALDKLLAKLVVAGTETFIEGRTIDGLLSALGYLQEQGLCGKVPGLNEFCAGLVEKRKGLNRPRSVTPAPLSALGAQLPALSIPPKLALPEAAAQTKADGRRKPIPGLGAIVEDSRLSEPARSVPSTSYLGPTVGKGKFVRTRSAKADPFSIAAYKALADEDHANAAGSADEEPHFASSAVEEQHGAAQTPDSASDKDHAVANFSEKPQAPANVVGVEALVAALHAGQAQQTEKLMRQLRSLPERRLPALPEAFLLELDSDAFLADKMRFKACNTYLSNLGKQDRQYLIARFENHPPTASKLRDLLQRQGMVKRSESEHVRESGSGAFGKMPERATSNAQANPHGSAQEKHSTIRPAQASAKRRKGANGAESGDKTARMNTTAGHNRRTRKVERELTGTDADTLYDMLALVRTAPSKIAPRLRELMEQGMDLNSPTAIGMTPLMIAAHEGATDVVLAMIKEGADVNVHTLNDNTALMSAASQGHTATVQALVRAGAKIDAVAVKGVTALMMALAQGHIQTVQALAKLGADVNVADHKGFTPLMGAVESGHMTAVQALIGLGANVNAADRDGYTALLIATREGHTAIVQALINAGADTNAVEVKGFNPLRIASAKGHATIVLALVQAGADVNATTADGESALMFAVESGHTATVLALTESGADVNAADRDGYTALLIAAREGHTAIVQALINAGADTNAVEAKGINPLRIASAKGHAAIVLALVQAGADVNATTADGESALMFAVENGHTATVLVLKEFGADVNAATSDGTTVLMLAAMAGDTAIMETLVHAGAVINAADSGGTTSLMHAVRAGHTAMVSRLLELGADVNAQQKIGTTALILAAVRGDTAMVRALVKKGANVNAAMADGTTALILAAHHGQTATVQALIKLGASVNAATDQGATALMRAAENGDTAMVKALLLAAARVDMVDIKGQTALSMAKEGGHGEVVKILQARQKS